MWRRINSEEKSVLFCTGFFYKEVLIFIWDRIDLIESWLPIQQLYRIESSCMIYPHGCKEN